MEHFLDNPAIEEHSYFKVWINGEEYFVDMSPSGEGGYMCTLFNSARLFVDTGKFYMYGETGIHNLDDLYQKFQASVRADFSSAEIGFEPIEAVLHDGEEFFATINQKGA